MNRTPEQNREVSPASNANPAGRAGRTVYTLPVGALSLVAQRADDEAERGAMDALVADQAIDMRVDWNGDASSLGHFEVLVGVSTWQKCELIDPRGVAGIDVISPSTTQESATVRARFQRGPVHRGCPFGVKAVPIAWKQALPAQLDSSYVAMRGQDYEYAGGLQPDLVPWTYSVRVDGVHRLILELSRGRDYEIWVRLQDPRDASKWMIQDPIVRTDPIGGEPTSERDGSVIA